MPCSTGSVGGRVFRELADKVGTQASVITTTGIQLRCYVALLPHWTKRVGSASYRPERKKSEPD
jgi:hypothetical protein